MAYVFKIILFQGWSLSFKVTMYNVHFFSKITDLKLEVIILPQAKSRQKKKARIAAC